MIVRSYHPKASERLNLNNTVQTVLGGVAAGWEQRPTLRSAEVESGCHQKASERLNLSNTVQAKRSAVIENLLAASVSERRDTEQMPIADIH